MATTLPPEPERLIAQAIDPGGYENADQVIERAFAQFERNEFFSAEASLADLEERKAAWLRVRE